MNFYCLLRRVFYANFLISGVCFTMKNKANSSLIAAQILINNGQYNSSIHCSYYAVFQYMKHILANTEKNAIPYEIQNEPRTESHDYIIDEIKYRINSSNKGRDFAQQVRVLKSYRTTADYHLETLTRDDSLEQKQSAENLISKLKAYFGNI